jgi:hypothetical protein
MWNALVGTLKRIFDIFRLKENEKKFDLINFCVVQPFKNVLIIAVQVLYETFSTK